MRPSATVFLLSMFPTLASAHSVWESESLRIDWNGFTSQTGGVFHLPYDVPGTDPTSLLTAGLIRLEWNAQIGESVTLDVHNRLFWRTSSGAGSSVGLGVSRPPPRTIDLKTEFINNSTELLEHDLDRFALNVMTPLGDLTLGRQAITWGVGSGLPVLDFWTQLSPFELDTTQKRGVDALRLLSYWGPLEVDAVVVDRGTLKELSGGIRVGWSASIADYHAMLLRSYDRVWAGMGIAADVDSFRPFLELSVPYDESEQGLAYPRATVGTFWTDGTWAWSAEGHYNGRSEVDYLGVAQSKSITRGEAFLLGRYYAMGSGSWTNQELTLGVSTITNIEDPSLLLTPSVMYVSGDNAQLRLSGFFGLGEQPDFEKALSIPSEFGAYGFAVFAEFSTYF